MAEPITVDIRIKNLNVHVHETDEGVVADIYLTAPNEDDDELVATTYAFFNQ